MIARVRGLVACAAAFVLCAPLAHATQPLPNVADPDAWTTNAPVDALARIGDTTYAGGGFTYVGPRTGSAVLLDATNGSDAGRIGAIGRVSAAVADGAGGFYIAGQITGVAGTHGGIVHVLSDGTVDSGFAPPPMYGDTSPHTDPTFDALALANGTLWAAGKIVQAGGQTRHGVVALDPATGALSSFDAPLGNGVGDPEVYAIAPADNGSIWVGGAFATSSGASHPYLAHIKSDGTTLGPAAALAPNGLVYALTIADGALYVGGEFTHLGSGGSATNIQCLGRYTLGGAATIDSGWDPHPDNIVRAITVPGNGYVYAGGDFAHIGATARSHLAAVAVSDGSLHPGFAPTTTDVPTQIPRVRALASDGTTIYAGGQFSGADGTPRAELAAFDRDTGALRSGFATGAGGPVYALAAGGGHLLVGGDFSTAEGEPRAGLAAFGPDGRATPWTPEVAGSVAALTPSADGADLFLGGFFTAVDGQPRANLAEVTSATGAVTLWRPDPDNDVRALALSADGSLLYAGGQFATIGALAADRPRLAAVSTTDALATNWRPAPVGSYVAAIATQGSDVYAGGPFTNAGAQASQPTTPNAAKIDASTGFAAAWNPGLDGQVFGLAVDGDTVDLAGWFANVSGNPAAGFGAVGTDGGTRSFAVAGPSTQEGRALALTPSGTLIVGGAAAFTTATAVLHEVDPRTGAATAWAPGLYDFADSLANVHAVSAAGRDVWVGGSFDDEGAASGPFDRPVGGLVRYVRPADPVTPTTPPATPVTPTTPTITTPPPVATTIDHTAPTLAKASLTHTRFALAAARTAMSAKTAHGTTIHFTLSETATVKITVERRRGRRYTKVVALTRARRHDRTSIPFSGRVGRTVKLSPGAYRFSITATDAAGNRSKTTRLSFTVLRR